jgi:hypothetical protein
MNISEPAIASGALQFETGDADSALFSPPLLLNAGDFRRLRFRISLAASGEGPKSDMAQLFWSTKSAAESEAASVRFPVILDGAERVAEVELASNPRWRGVLTRLRFDPCGRAGVRVRIRSVELLP